MKTLSILLDEYLEHQRSLGYSPVTLRQTRYGIRGCIRCLDEKRGVTTPDRLWKPHLLAWRNATAFVMGKGRKERVVPIGRTAMRYLETYVRAVRPCLAKNDGEKALFLDKEGQRLPYFSLRRIVIACAQREKVGITVTPHTFRRSCTTELLRGGAGMYHVKELLGHESLETLRHYARLTITELKRTHAKCHPSERDDR